MADAKIMATFLIILLAVLGLMIFGIVAFSTRLDTAMKYNRLLTQASCTAVPTFYMNNCIYNCSAPGPGDHKVTATCGLTLYYVLINGTYSIVEPYYYADIVVPIVILSILSLAAILISAVVLCCIYWDTACSRPQSNKSQYTIRGIGTIRASTKQASSQSQEGRPFASNVPPKDTISVPLLSASEL
jgi:hypothetical protein